MSSDSDNSDHPPGPLATSTGEVLETLAEARPRSDLTYRLIEGVKLTGANLHQSLLTGSILRDSSFTEVDFSRCDLDGVRIEGCSFVNCDLTNVDVRSAAIANTSFVECNLSSAYITDTAFAGASVTHCRFNNAVVTSCSFSAGTLSASDIAQSSFTHNRFDRTQFDHISLGDCTFLYNIMRSCSFSETSFNAESLGMTYGLTIDAIDRLGILYLGKTEVPPPPGQRADALLSTYAQRRWLLGVCILSMTFKRTSHAAAIREYFRAIASDMKRGRPLRRDELSFVVTVLEELAADRELPLLSCVDAIDFLAALASAPGSASDAVHSQSLAQILLSRARYLLQTMLDRFREECIAPEPLEASEPALLTASFAVKPAVPFAALLSEVAAVADLAGGRVSQTVSARDGSYIEVIETTLGSLLAFQIFLYLLNGFVIQVTELRARLSVLFRPRLPRAYRDEALQPRQNLPTYLAAPVQKLLAHVSGLAWLQDPALKGLAPSNLTALSVEPPAKDGDD